jgi:hypothetical protein
MAQRIEWEIWETNGVDACDRCRALHGQLFRRGEGPQPPLHNFSGPPCKGCKRRWHHTEVVDAASDLRLVKKPEGNWVRIVLAEITAMVDFACWQPCLSWKDHRAANTQNHSPIIAEERGPNWRGVTR